MNRLSEIDILRDEVRTLRAALNMQIEDANWANGRIGAEFCKVVILDNAEVLYVHCEQAWGETDDEFETRYDRVRKREAARLRIKKVTTRDPEGGEDE